MGTRLSKRRRITSVIPTMKYYIYNWNSTLDEVIAKFQKEGKLAKTWQEADKIILWCESGLYDWKDRILEAQKTGKEVILYQQGIWAFEWVKPPFNEGIISDKALVWGEGDKKRMIKYGVPEDKIKVVGCPIYKHLKPRVTHTGKNVVFALEHWDIEDVVENQIVAAELRKLEGINIITKGLMNENTTFIYDNPVESGRSLGKSHFEIVADTLSKADLVVGLSESTFQFLAECLDIPVVVADLWIPKTRGRDERYLNFKGEFSNAVTKVKLQDLNKEIYRQLKHPEILRKERAEAVIENGGINIDNPVERICQEIES